jgi:hypothetical protein
MSRRHADRSAIFTATLAAEVKSQAQRPLRNSRPTSERLIRARLARPRRESHWVCAATDENAARRDAGSREPGEGFATVSQLVI